MNLQAPFPDPHTGNDRTDRPVAPADCRSREELTAVIRAGAEPNWLLFWGHRPPKTGGVSASCLSQWWPAPFTADGTRYRTAEHWMMASKAQLFGDEEIHHQILASDTPADAKRLGRRVRGYDENTWARVRFELVVRGSVLKFGQHAALLTFLLATIDRVLVEASPRDNIWGIGISATDARATDPDQWRGLNLLGFALMEARSRLRREQNGALTTANGTSP
ncbi:NADAR family protein [Nocardia nova]|uniref:NADAR family protein n=1 Tax=Nocardia nova TaxID=37330 RepID=UPI0033F36719